MRSWTYLDGDGNEVGASPGFGSQEEAEAWLAQQWEALADDGVRAVELTDPGTGVVSYRMSLDPSEG